MPDHRRESRRQRALPPAGASVDKAEDAQTSDRCTAPVPPVTFDKYDRSEIERLWYGADKRVTTTKYGGWTTLPYEGDKLPADAEHISCGVFAGAAPTDRKREAASGMWMVVIDDPDPDNPPAVEPTVKVWTSLGKSQFWFVLSEPVPVDKAAEFMRRMGHAGLSGWDTSGNSVVRLVRLPGSMPTGKNNRAELREFHPERTFKLDELALELGLPEPNVADFSERREQGWADRIADMDARLEMVAVILAHIEKPDVVAERHDYMVQVLGMPMWRYLKGDQRGKALLIQWVKRNWPSVKRPEEDIDKHWRNMTDRDGPARTIGTLIAEGREHGWDAEPWWKRADEAGEVDLSPSPAGPRPATEGEASPTPVTRPPGVLGRLFDHIDGAAFKDNPQASLAGALAAGSALCGNMAYLDRGGRLTPASALQLLLLGNTGSGKNSAITGARGILDGARASQRILEPKSGPGFVHGLAAERGIGLVLMDEFSEALEAIATRSGTGGHKAEIMTRMMEAYGLCASALSRGAAATAQSRTPTVHLPCATGLYCATAELTIEAMSSKDITGGKLNRMIVLHGPKRAKRKSRPVSGKLSAEDFAELEERWVRPLSSENINRRAGEPFEQRIIPPSPAPGEVGLHHNPRRILALSSEAEALFMAFEDRMEAMLDVEDDVVLDLWSRGPENALRIATMVSALDWQPEVSAEAAQWAIDFVTACVEGLLQHAAPQIAEGPLDRAVKGTMRWIAKLADGRGYAPWRDIANRISRRRGVTVKAVKQELLDSGLIRIVPGNALNGELGVTVYTGNADYVRAKG